MTEIRRRIASRALPPGARLPSVRSFAKAMNVSTSTVVEAYDRLVAEDAVRSRPGSGFYVANAFAPLSLADLGPRLDRAIDPFWVSRLSLEASSDMAKPGCGWMPADWMPQEVMRRALRNITRGNAAQLSDYSTPLGLLPFRELLSRRLCEQSIMAGADQIILVDSGTHAIDLLCRFLLEPGQTVLVDDPCYFNFHALLRAHRVNVIGIPYLTDGPDVTQFEQAVTEHQPKLYITNSGIHNPTGAALSPMTAHRLLMLAERAGMTVIEDDIFADFEERQAPRLTAFNGLRRSVQIGSFSKTLSASVRCGYIAAPKTWIEPLTDIKIATTFSGNQMNERLVFTALKDSHYRRHMESLKARLSGMRLDVASRLGEIGITPWINPAAGIFLWCRLPDEVDAATVARYALTKNMVLAPGSIFSNATTSRGFMRFNVSQCDCPHMIDILHEGIRASKAIS